MFARLVRQYSTQLKNIKPPTAEVPDVSSFLTKIGRSMDQHAEHFENWESLIGTDGKKLKALGIDTRDRRYILAWVEKFKQGVPLEECKRGKKQWGGERNRRANRAAHYGRKAAEERESR